MFSRALSALNAKNDAAFGPLIVIALIYMAIGFTLSLFIKRFFWVPYRFRYGILVAGGWASSCDITMSVMTDIMASLPFNSVYDQDLAVTYVSAFCVIFYLTILTCGRNLIERDFIGPDTSDEQAKSVSSSAAEKNNDLERNAYSDTMSSRDLSPQLSSLEHSLADSPSTSTIVQHDTPSGICNDSQSSIDAQPHTMPPSTENSSHNKPRPAMRYVNLLCNLSFPVLLSVVISLVVSRISALKALFIPNVSGTNVPPAPDGQPPLAFIMDTAAYLGAASSPIGLIILGSAIARMSIPRGRWTALPLRAIVTLAVGKQLIMPVLGVLICEGFTQIGFIHAEDKVLRFVCIFVSCLPIASSQVILTQAFSDATTTDHLVAFLLPQLILMPGVMAVLMAFTLNLLFG